MSKSTEALKKLYGLEQIPEGSDYYWVHDKNLFFDGIKTTAIVFYDAYTGKVLTFGKEFANFTSENPEDYIWLKPVEPFNEEEITE